MPKKRAASKSHLEASVRLSSRGVARLQARHPWVYRSDIVEAKDVLPGATVRVLDSRGKFLGTALYSSSSQIAIRMISHGSVGDLPGLVAERIRAAIGYRKELVRNTDAYRIVFSEADFLPGLIVDRYNDVVTLQLLTQASCLSRPCENPTGNGCGLSCNCPAIVSGYAPGKSRSAGCTFICSTAMTTPTIRLIAISPVNSTAAVPSFVYSKSSCSGSAAGVCSTHLVFGRKCVI